MPPRAFALPPALPQFKPWPPVAVTLVAALAMYLWVWPWATLNTGSLIKLTSIATAMLLATATWRLMVALKVERPERLAACLMVMPSVASNVALLGQGDSLYAAPLILAVACAVERRHAPMLLWVGAALAVSSKAAFIAPFFLALLIARRVPFRLWLLMPLVFALCMVSAWLAGWPASDLATIDLSRESLVKDLSRNAPNIWTIVQLLPAAGVVPLTGLAIAAAVGASALYVAHFSVPGMIDRAPVAAAALAPLLVVGLLPQMHEHYFLVADILVLAYAAAAHTRYAWTTAALAQAGSMLGIVASLSGTAGLDCVGAVAMIVATVRLGAPLFRRPANDNPLPCKIVQSATVR